MIVGGVAPPPGDTLWAQSRWLAQDGHLRDLVLNEPRGGVFRHVNLLVPPKDPRAVMGFLIMEPEHNPPMSGSNAICVSTVLLDTGLVAMQEPVTEFLLEAPGGLVQIKAHCANGKAERIEVQNVFSFALALDQSLELPDGRTLSVDTAYGGDSFVIVDAEALGVELVPEHARYIADQGRLVTRAANASLTFNHPEQPDWRHFSFCLFATPVERYGRTLLTHHACTIEPGKIDRSPTGTAVSARMAVLHAREQMTESDELIASSIIDSEFRGRIDEIGHVGDLPAIRPRVSGRAWITGTHQYHLDPDDPYPRGYRITDTWPAREIT